MMALRVLAVPLRAMIINMGVFGDIPAQTKEGYKDALNSAYDDFLAWKKELRLSCSQNRFNHGGLFNDAYGAFMNAKGHNARVVAEWLVVDVLSRLRRSDWPTTVGRKLGVENAAAYMSEVAMTLGIEGVHFQPHSNIKVSFYVEDPHVMPNSGSFHHTLGLVWCATTD